MRIRISCPVHGDTRVVKKFLLLPKCIDGDCRWLEVGVFEQKFFYPVGLVDIGRWSDVRWID